MTETPKKRSKWRKRLRMAAWTLAIGSAVVLAGGVSLFYWASTPAFETWVRMRLVEKLEQATGGRVEVGSFHWQPLHLESELEGLVIHGLEGPGEAPLVRVERLRARLRIRDFWSPRILLSNLEAVHPGFHLIVYADGSTNEPRPRRPRPRGKSMVDSIFDIEAGRIAIEQGVFEFQDRAAAFDYQDRFTLLDFRANDFSLRMSYQPAAGRTPELYRVEAGAADMSVARGEPGPKSEMAQASLQTTIDLARNAIEIRSLRLATVFPGERPRALEITGSIQDFSHPRWQGRVAGELDMRALEPATGYPYSPQGIARLDLGGMGQGGLFRIDGGLHVENGSYVDPDINATGIGLDAHVHADAEQLLITSIVARFKPGGRIEGRVALDHWLPPIPGAATLQRPGESSVAPVPGTVPKVRLPSPAIETPVNGKVTAELKDLSLDTLLDIVGEPPLQRLGFDTRLSGPATATWTKGDTATLVVGATLNLAQPSQTLQGEVRASGAIEGTYAQRTGKVDLRKFELITPGGQLAAHGDLGAYPATSPSSLAVDFHSKDLSDFDTVLTNLGLARNGHSGVDALPADLEGQLDFHGTWTGSLVDPQLAGTAQATDIAIETGSAARDETGQPQWIHWDSVDAAGSYSAARIDITHGTLRNGPAEIALSGSLLSAPAPPSPGRRAGEPAFGEDSTLRLHLHASKVGMDQLIPLIGRKLPLNGAFDTQLDLNGPIRSLAGSGWAEMRDGAINGQRVDHVRAQGALTGPALKITSVSVSGAGGKIDASGDYNLKTRQFHIDSRGDGVDLARIDMLRRHGLEPAGKLSFTVAGSGTPEDPRLDGRATFAGFELNGESLGPLQVTVHTANRALIYEASTRVRTASLEIHGQTALRPDYSTQARLEFSEFNIGALLAMAHLQGLSGESSLAGTVTLDGPLARPDELRGEAHISELAASISGVHLKSDGGLHASLGGGVARLDPLHITGEETDLHLQGTLGLKRENHLDFAASGTINFKLGQMLDPDLTAGGTTTFQVEGHGPVKSPDLTGRIEFQNGSLALGDLPNGLSQLRGTLEFNQNRLEVKSLTAMSGGGLLSVSGYLAYQHGLYADLRVDGKGIRIRYPNGVSSLANGAFHLQGMENNLLLSGNVMITRFSVSPDLDFAALVTQANSVQTAIVPPDAPSNHIRLDVRITSAPQLNFQNTVAKLAGDVDLRLRGTLASPNLLGSIQITEGNATIAGTRYELQRGAISFTNPVRIEPSIDLNATAHVSDYDITLGLHGTPAKMSISYRSDPPLPEQDVVALLALGRTGDQQRLYTQQQEQETASQSTDALLGGALNATVSSRVQKLFGAGSVKIDPNYIGALGNSTSRIIVEEQVGRDLTLTYATNVDTTQQQLLQAEIAINRHVSLLVARDESGVFSMVVKATRRYR